MDIDEDYLSVLINNDQTILRTPSGFSRDAQHMG